MQQTIHGGCTELTVFVCEYLSVCLSNPFSREAFYCIHHPHRKHEQDQLFLGLLVYLFFWEDGASIPFLCFSSVADQIKYAETPKLSEQYFHDQESETKVSICNFSACSHAVCQAPQLYSRYLYHILEMVLQFLYRKHYMRQKYSIFTHLKPFSSYLLHLKRKCVRQLHRY